MLSWIKRRVRAYEVFGYAPLCSRRELVEASIEDWQWRGFRRGLRN